MKLTTDLPGEPPIIWEWMHKRTGLPMSDDLRCIATMREDGTIAGAIAMNFWTEGACFMHMAFDNKHSLTRDLLRASFHYVFVESDRKAAYGLTPKDHTAACTLNKKFGFRQIAETVDSVIFEMRHDECRWLKGGKR